MNVYGKPTLMFDTNAFIGRGRSKHERVHERFRVVLQRPLLHEVAGNFVAGKPNSQDLPAEEYVAKLIDKFQGHYAFMSVAETLCARELRGETLRLNGAPYTQDHFDAFHSNGDPLGLVAVDGNGQPVPPPVYWMNRVRGSKPARDPNDEPTPGPFDAEHVLGDAFGLLDRVGSASSNEELLTRVRGVLCDPGNALALMRFTANASTPASNTNARSRLHEDARRA